MLATETRRTQRKIIYAFLCELWASVAKNILETMMAQLGSKNHLLNHPVLLQENNTQPE